MSDNEVVINVIDNIVSEEVVTEIIDSRDVVNLVLSTDEHSYSREETDALLNEKSNISHNHNLNDLTEKSYLSLTDKPDIPEVPTKLSEFEKDINFDERYYTESEVNTLLGGKENVIAKKTAFNKDFGTTADTVCQGNDARLSDSRNPLNHNHSALDINAGTLPTSRGGTNNTTWSSNRLVYSSTSNKLENSAIITPNRAVISDINGLPIHSAITTAELNTLSGISTNIQSQFTNKADVNHNHDSRYYTETETNALLANKQETLVSGTNIKTVNNQSLLGSGNITIEGGGTGDHSALSNRNIADQHPISSITGLESALGAKEPANANIQSHIANTDIHVTTTDKSNWDGKAEISDIPTALSGLTKDINFDERYYTETETNTLLSAKENSFSKNTAFNKNFGSTVGTVCEGNDARLSDARTPITHNHNDLYYTESEVNSLLSSKSDTSHNHSLANLTEKSYNSLTDKPTLFSGSYSDLTNKPKLTFGVQIKSSEDIPTGSKFIRSFANAGAIKKWTISSVESGSIEFDVKKAAYADLPTYTSIATVKPNLSSQTKNTANVDWAFNAGDFIEISVYSNSGIKNVVLSMEIE